MSQPTPYDPTVSFQQEETNNVAGRSTVRTAALDVELVNIATSIDEILTNLSLIQRDDGEIRDGMVKLHTLGSDVLSLIGSGNGSAWTPRGSWLTATAYALYDIVANSGTTYLCIVAHTSGTFATDLAAGKWMVIATPLAASVSANQVVYGSGGGAVTGSSNLTFDGTTLTLATGAFTTGGTTALSLKTSGGEQLRVSNVASAVNYLKAQGGATGNYAGLSVDGTDANVILSLSAKGTQPIDLYTNAFAERQVRIQRIASAVNYLQLQGSATGNGVFVGAQGSDTNVSLGIYSKGTGSLLLSTGGSAYTQVLIANVTNAVNYLQLSGSTTGNGVLIQSSGADSNVTLGLSSRGTSPISMYTNGFANLAAQFLNTASAVNYLTVTPAATGNGVAVSTAGSDTNVSLNYITKGTGGHNFYTAGAGSGVAQLSITDSASNTAGWQFAGGTAAVACLAVATGANCGMTITPKGTGNIVMVFSAGSGGLHMTGHSTTASAANAYIDSVSGQIARSTSSMRYKKLTQAVSTQFAAGILDAASKSAMTYASDTGICKFDNPDLRWYGFSAEDIANVDPLLVDFNDKGQPERVQYERFVVPLTCVVADHERRLKALETIKG